MRDKQEFTIDVVSKIDDEIIDRNLQKRFTLLFSLPRRKKLKALPIIAAAACFFFCVTTLLLIFPFDAKQVPVYQGMTVSGEAPTVNTAAISTMPSLSVSTLGTRNVGASGVTLLKDSKMTDAPVIDAPDKKGTDSPNVLDPTKTYYALPNEDIYINVHLSNPDGFEILSFTLNGVKYSSYMFEEGSDLETLVLKYNVGNKGGMQEYTIDAIKYVDGNKIKDVRMEGDKTIQVFVNSNDQAVNFNARLSGWDLSISPKWSASAGASSFTSLAIYDGDKKLMDYSPSTTVFRNLPGGKKLVLIGTYAGGTKTAAYVFKTPTQSEGLIIVDGVIAGIGSCTDSVLYINLPIGDRAFSECQHIKEVFLGSGVTSIGEDAFYVCRSLNKITLSSGLKTIGNGAFSNCVSLTGVSIPNSVDTIGNGAFANCDSLTSITVPNSVTTLGNSVFVGCDKLTSVTLGNGITTLGYYIFGANILRPDGSLTPTKCSGLFEECASLKTVKYNGTTQQWNAISKNIEAWMTRGNDITLQCTNGNIILSCFELPE